MCLLKRRWNCDRTKVGRKKSFLKSGLSSLFLSPLSSLVKSNSNISWTTSIKTNGLHTKVKPQTCHSNFPGSLTRPKICQEIIPFPLPHPSSLTITTTPTVKSSMDRCLFDIKLETFFPHYHSTGYFG